MAKKQTISQQTITALNGVLKPLQLKLQTPIGIPAAEINQAIAAIEIQLKATRQVLEKARGPWRKRLTSVIAEAEALCNQASQATVACSSSSSADKLPKVNLPPRKDDANKASAPQQQTPAADRLPVNTLMR